MATVNYIPYQKQTRAVLQRVADYVRRGDKTEGQRYVSGLNCSPQLAAEEFMATRLLHGKDSPVWFYHYTQSFSPTEAVTPQQAHALAEEFAARAWPDSEVLIATHTDAKHIHSHFLVNAVCHENGRMLRQGPRTLEHLRSVSDGLCLVHGLSVVKPRQKPVRGMSSREYRAAEKGQSWKFELMNVIDDCMCHARSRRDFIRRMRERGYEVKWTPERKYITYTTPTGMKCRDNKLHDEKYLKEAMERELRIRETIIYGRAEGAQQAAGTTDAGAVHDAGGMGVSVGTDRGAGPAECGNLFVAPTAANVGDAGTGGEAGGGGADTDRDAPTGWEDERNALLAAQTPALQPPLAAGGPGAAGDDGGLVGGVFRLGHAVESLQDAPPVNDATARPQQVDSKQLRKEQIKKIALGHKADDHEDAQWQQMM